MKKYTVTLERTVKQVATITVDAKDKRTAAFAAASHEQKWTDGEVSPLKIAAIDVVPEPELKLVDPAKPEHKKKIVSV